MTDPNQVVPRYRTYSEYLKNKYGEKVYKIPINLPGTCPNRDGKLGEEGCIFCDEDGSGFECFPNSMAIEEQLQKNKKFFSERFKAKKFIVYFQAFSNTYWPIEKLQSFIETAACEQDIVGVSISTRPDCINDKYLDVLEEISYKYNVNIDIELGLQTVNYRTLEKINRGHTLAEFIDALMRIKKRNFSTCIHIILNLPWDDMEDIIECSKLMSALQVDQIKLHSLYVVEGTRLAEMYKQNEFSIISLEEYVERVVTFLRYLSYDIVVQRLIGKGPKDKVLFNNWDRSWWHVKEKIDQKLVNRDVEQGDKCDYLNGKALY
ncbi:TIGR01212 family radical SAM protein [Natranaerobius trueperi]|uniref:TIGR01212 family radical SAM protein n=1 Tax=Natranaerobius trueperi TaxID=759412 RepID=A0A226BVJ0_9FIRM|nr:TIGR01212 family radical SAM protein [Natranaerobius trueperi]OWZ82911.1 TIGR01212 family radical SAM protein [Natranaerobius trueperi]